MVNRAVSDNLIAKHKVRKIESSKFFTVLFNLHKPFA